MATFKFSELGNDVGDALVDDFLGGIRGPLSDVVRPKHGTYRSLAYPADIEGIGERHFVRFSIVEEQPLKIAFDNEPKESDATETPPDESASGEFLGAAIGAAAGDAIGGALGGFAGGLIGDVATGVIDGSGLGGGLDTGVGEAVSFAGDVVGGAVEVAGTVLEGAADLAFGALDAVSAGIGGVLPENAAARLGRLTAADGELRAAIEKKVPLTKDGLKDLLKQSEEFGNIEGGTTSILGDIIMYVPVGIQETFQNEWSGSDMGMAKVLEGAIETLTGEGGTMEKISKLADEAMNVAPEMLGRMAGNKLGINDLDKYLLKKGIKIPGVDTPVGGNLAKNPHFEMFYSKPAQRTFSFDFKMIPRNAQEAYNIHEIVKTFKIYSAPALIEEGLGDRSRYYRYPSLFRIEYWNENKIHKILPCALTNITVNYSGSGTPGTYRDGHPIQTDLTLTFMESELLTRDKIVSGY